MIIDGPVPVDGASNITMMARAAPTFERVVRRALDAGELFPRATQAHPHPTLTAVLENPRPHGRRFFEEPIRLPSMWPDAPCGYLRLSSDFEPAAAIARAAGWPCDEVERGHHFLLVTEPEGVASHLERLLAKLLTVR